MLVYGSLCFVFLFLSSRCGGSILYSMIAQLTGTVAKATERMLVLNVQGVGYEVFVTRDVAAKYKVGTALTLFTHLSVKEDAHELYGFADQAYLAMFKLLLSVSGIGPKSALNILDATKPEDIRRAVLEQDADGLHRVHGLGRKTAERLVTELKDKLEAVAGLTSGTMSDDTMLMEAIESLGYSAAEARRAVQGVRGKGEGLAERVKLALRQLSGQ